MVLKYNLWGPISGPRTVIIEGLVYREVTLGHPEKMYLNGIIYWSFLWKQNLFFLKLNSSKTHKKQFSVVIIPWLIPTCVKNGGTCVNLRDSSHFRCSCTYEWQGRDCSDPVPRPAILVGGIDFILVFVFCIVSLLGKYWAKGIRVRGGGGVNF